MLGMWSLQGHFGVLEHLTKSGIAISAWVKARLSLLPLCQEQDAFANTEEPEWPNPTSPRGRGSSGISARPGSCTASCDQATAGKSPGGLGAKQPTQAGPPGPSGAPCVCSILGCVALPTVRFTAQNHIQEGNSACAVPCLCFPHSSQGREVSPAQKYLKRILMSHFIWIRICASFDWLKVTCQTLIATRGS